MNDANVITVIISTSARYHRLEPNKPWSLADQRTLPNLPQQNGGNEDRNGYSFQDETIYLAIEYLLKLAAENLPRTSTSTIAKLLTKPQCREPWLARQRTYHSTQHDLVQYHDEIYLAFFAVLFYSREPLVEASVEILVALVRVVDVLGHFTNIPSEIYLNNSNLSLTVLP